MSRIIISWAMEGAERAVFESGGRQAIRYEQG